MCIVDWCGCGGSIEIIVFCYICKFGIGGMSIKLFDFIGFYGCEKVYCMFDYEWDVNWLWEGVCCVLIKILI